MPPITTHRRAAAFLHLLAFLASLQVALSAPHPLSTADLEAQNTTPDGPAPVCTAPTLFPEPIDDNSPFADDCTWLSRLLPFVPFLYPLPTDTFADHDWTAGQSGSCRIDVTVLPVFRGRSGIRDLRPAYIHSEDVARALKMIVSNGSRGILRGETRERLAARAEMACPDAWAPVEIRVAKAVEH